ncbi:hypothetical protein, partial [Micrococcus luteus]|uniref:hypothetical protein n=1 Tax=Micrococcus luteus TaxID=1270 RepID=UPI001642F1F4
EVGGDGVGVVVREVVGVREGGEGEVVEVEGVGEKGRKKRGELGWWRSKGGWWEEVLMRGRVWVGGWLGGW